MIDISELVRIIGDSGYILIGCNSNRWAYNQALEDLQQYTDTGVKLMTMQGAELLPEDYLSDENKEQASIPSEQEKYWLAVMRRGPRPS
jgi:2-iminoacetate synthase ThiH